MLVALAHRVNGKAATWVVWPSLQSIALDTGVTRRQIMRVLARLETAGAIKREARWSEKGTLTNKYHLVHTRGGDAHVTPGGTHMSPGGDAHDAPGVTHMSLNEQEQQQEVNKKKEALAKKSPTGTAPKGAKTKSTEKEGNVKASDAIAKVKGKYAGVQDSVLLSLPLTTPHGKVSPARVADLWRTAHGKYGEGFLGSLTNAQTAMLAGAAKRVGLDVFPEAVVAAMRDWPGFTSHCKNTSTAFKPPVNPNIGFFVKYVDEAVNFAAIDQGPTPQQLQPIAKKKHAAAAKPVTLATPANVPATQLTAADLDDIEAQMDH